MQNVSTNLTINYLDNPFNKIVLLSSPNSKSQTSELNLVKFSKLQCSWGVSSNSIFGMNIWIWNLRFIPRKSMRLCTIRSILTKSGCRRGKRSTGSATVRDQNRETECPRWYWILENTFCQKFKIECSF